MLKIRKASQIYSYFSKTLKDFLEDYMFLEDEEFFISKKDLNTVCREHAKIILDKFDNDIIVNNVKWHHFKCTLFPQDSILNIFLSQLRSRKNFIQKRFLDNIPDKVIDIEKDNINGELKEELIKLIDL